MYHKKSELVHPHASARSLRMYVCMYASSCMYVIRTDTYIHTYVCMHACMCVCVCVKLEALHCVSVGALQCLQYNAATL